MEQHLIADIPVKALIVKDDKILITKDRRWELPGGRMNVGEVPEEALHREISEELGVSITILNLQNAFVRTDSNPTHMILVYHCELVKDASFQTDSNEVQDMRWISKDDDLSEMDFFPGYADMLRKFFEKCA